VSKALIYTSYFSLNRSNNVLSYFFCICNQLLVIYDFLENQIIFFILYFVINILKQNIILINSLRNYYRPQSTCIPNLVYKIRTLGYYFGNPVHLSKNCQRKPVFIFIYPYKFNVKPLLFFLLLKSFFLCNLTQSLLVCKQLWL
jgi:hypothetical protein